MSKKKKESEPVLVSGDIRYPCGGYFQHHHRSWEGAKVCTIIQFLFPLHWMEYTFLKIFRKTYLKKLQAAYKGSNKRALLRRKKRGLKPL